MSSRSDAGALARAGDALASARSIFVLTGSGISAESGIPTFRGDGGLWNSLRFEDLASPAGFERDPVLVWTWYNERLAAHRKAEPNAGHRALADLERAAGSFALATQNVDSLHLRAGSRNLFELHGNLREARCTDCSERRGLHDGLPLDEIEHACGGRWRPDIVWFGEALPATTWDAAFRAASTADAILVVGTSALVYPAAALAIDVPKTGATIVEINPESTPLSEHATIVLRGTASTMLPPLAAAARTGA